MAHDPYRTTGGPGRPPVCPRCHGKLTGDPTQRMACTIGGCGELWSLDTVARILEMPDRRDRDKKAGAHFASMLRQVIAATPCPVCAASMTVVIIGRVVLDHCIDHGIWLDAGEREQLDKAHALRGVLGE